MITLDELKKEFRSKFKVCKDLGSIRPKYTLQEDMWRAVETYAASRTCLGSVSRSGPSWQGSDNEMRAYYRTNASQTLGLFYCGGRAGVPTYKVGVQTESDWVNIREHLRSVGMARLKGQKRIYEHKYPNKLIPAKINRLSELTGHFIFQNKQQNNGSLGLYQGESLEDFYLRVAKTISAIKRVQMSDHEYDLLAKETRRREEDPDHIDVRQ